MHILDLDPDSLRSFASPQSTISSIPPKSAQYGENTLETNQFGNILISKRLVLQHSSLLQNLDFN